MPQEHPVVTDGDLEASGFIGCLSEGQVQALAALRSRMGSRVQHPRFTDLLLLRFLRARKFNVEAAESMLADHLVFREEYGLNKEIGGSKWGPGPSEQCFPELKQIKRHYPHGYHCTDREGCPVYIEQIGKLDVQSLMQVCSSERLLQYFIHESERSSTYRLPACSLACGRLVETGINILDLDGLSFRAVTHTTARKTLQALTQIQQNQFPETMKTMIIVNAPKVFSLAWSFVKPMLDAKTVAKIQIYSCDPAKYTPRLLELIRPEDLPAFLGGTCVCPEGCVSSNKGPWNEPRIQQMLAETPYWEILSRFTQPDAIPAGLSPLHQNGHDEASPVFSSLPSVPCVGNPADAPPSVAEHPAAVASQDIPGHAESEECALLMEELAETEQAHIQTLERWLEKSAEMTEVIGVTRIERAQGYYDGLALKKQAAMRLEVLAADFQKLMQTHNERTRELDAAEKELLTQRAGGAQFDEESFMARVTQLNELTCAVSELQRNRDLLHAKYSNAMDELRLAQARVEELQQEHENCSWNCSIALTRPYFEGRTQHEEVVEQQVKHMDSIVKRLAEVTIKWKQGMDKGDAKDFELRGPQVQASPVSPQEADGFYSCSEGEDD